MFTDTIVAISSPPAVGGAGGGVRGIVRVSGAGALEVAGAVTDLGEGARVGWHSGVLVSLWDVKLACGALLFRGPRSFTGEDVVELHVPNSPAILRGVVEALLVAGGRTGEVVRLAGPGEFSARAFFNGKIDLTQAEGIAATISAGNQMELRAAARLREGELHRRIEALAESVAEVLALVEAGIDFADEEGVRFIERRELAARLGGVVGAMDELLCGCVRIDQLAAPPTVAFLGKPNVGKSSLINALAGVERSIVSPVAGTTRDILAVMMKTGRGEVRLLDMPGEEAGEDELSRKMMEARAGALLDVDLVVEVCAADEEVSEASRGHGALRVAIVNKVDLAKGELGGEAWQRVSAKTGLHVGELREAIGELVVRRETLGSGRIVLNHRHRAALRDAAEACGRAAELAGVAERHPEFLAAELRGALDILGQITGAISPDEVLGRIFSRFCIGK